MREALGVVKPKDRKRLRKLERRVAKLEGARMFESPAAVDVSGDELDVHGLLDAGVDRWAYYVDDDYEDWSARGYL